MTKKHIKKVVSASVLMSSWKKLKDRTGGKLLFSMYIGVKSPYTGTLLARVEELEPGYCKVRMRHRFWLGNPFGTIHAFALGNLGEMVSGLAFLTGLPADATGALVECDKIKYLAWSHGTMTAICKCDLAETSAEAFYILTAEIYNEEGKLCAVVKLTWLVKPKKK